MNRTRLGLLFSADTRLQRQSRRTASDRSRHCCWMGGRAGDVPWHPRAERGLSREADPALTPGAALGGAAAGTVFPCHTSDSWSLKWVTL